MFASAGPASDLVRDGGKTAMVETRVSPDFADQALRLAGTKRALVAQG